MSLGLAVFDKLCQVGNELEALKDVALPGSDTWCGLCELVQAIDLCIDLLVDSAPLEDDDRGSPECLHNPVP